MTVVATATVKVNADTRDLKDAEKAAERLTNSFKKMKAAAEQVRADAMANQIRMADPFQKTAVAAEKSATSIRNVAAASRTAALPTRQLATSFAGMAANMVGLPPVIGRVAATLGTFAAGGAIALGVGAGLTLIAAGYSKIKGAAEEARKASDDFAKSLRDLVNAGNGTGNLPAPIGGLMERARLIERGDPGSGLSRFPQTVPGSPVFQGSLLDMRAERATLNPNTQGRRIAALDKKILTAETQLALVTGRILNLPQQPELNPLIATINAKGPKKKKPFDPTRELGLSGMIDAGMDAHFARRTSPQEWLERRIEGAATAGFQMRPMQPMASNLELRAMSDVPVKLESLGNKIKDGFMSVSGELLSGLTNIAQQMAFLGGKGKGSQIGGWAGGLIGGALKLGGGPLGVAAGTIVGTMAGSLFGGLFDKKKKVASGLDMMATQLSRVNQQLRNMPRGYKVNQMQYDATTPMGPPPTNPGRPGGGGPGIPGIPEGGNIIVMGDLRVMANNTAQMVREIGRAVISEGTRGGTNGLVLVGG